jgi:hypothetical protein
VRLRRKYRRRRAVAEQARAHQHAQVVIQVEAALQTSTQIEEDMPRTPGSDERFARAQVGKRRAAPLADEVQQRRIALIPSASET